MDDDRDLQEVEIKLRSMLPNEGIPLLERYVQLIKSQAGSDYLTGLPLRRDFMEKGTRQLERAKIKINKEPIAYLALDIDHFKQVNDVTGYQGKKGHVAGDLLLQDVARKILGPTARASDLIGRIGGEEFGVLLGEATQSEAIQVAERLRKRMHDLTGNTVSIGIKGYTKIPSDLNLERLMGEADSALYIAKETGRNRCRVYSPKEELHLRVFGTTNKH